MPFFGKETGPIPSASTATRKPSWTANRRRFRRRPRLLGLLLLCAVRSDEQCAPAPSLQRGRADIAFCLFGGVESSIDYFKAQTDFQISIMREPGYMKVLDGRPLFFIFSAPDEQLSRDGGTPKLLNGFATSARN